MALLPFCRVAARPPRLLVLLLLALLAAFAVCVVRAHADDKHGSSPMIKSDKDSVAVALPPSSENAVSVEKEFFLSLAREFGIAVDSSTAEGAAPAGSSAEKNTKGEAASHKCDVLTKALEKLKDPENINKVKITPHNFVDFLKHIVKIKQGKFCTNNPKPEDETENTFLTWLYAFVSVTVITLFSAAGIFVLKPLERAPKVKSYIMIVLVGMAVGVMLADSFLHLMPEAMSLEKSNIEDFEVYLSPIDETKAENHDQDRDYDHDEKNESQKTKLENAHGALGHGFNDNFYAAVFILIGVLFFYIADHLMSLFSLGCDHNHHDTHKMPHEATNPNSVASRHCPAMTQEFPAAESARILARSSNGESSDCNDADCSANENRLQLEPCQNSHNCLESSFSEPQSSNNSPCHEPSSEKIMNSSDDICASPKYQKRKKVFSFFTGLRKKDEKGDKIHKHAHSHGRAHAHKHSHKHKHSHAHDVMPIAWLILLGDALHNFLDGIAIGVMFAKSPLDGMVSSLSIAAHELPHELADYTILVFAGLSPGRAALYNMASNLTSFIGAAIGLLLQNAFQNSCAEKLAVSFTAGSFIYIALADLVPLLVKLEVDEKSDAAAAIAIEDYKELEEQVSDQALAIVPFTSVGLNSPTYQHGVSSSTCRSSIARSSSSYLAASESRIKNIGSVAACGVALDLEKTHEGVRNGAQKSVLFDAVATLEGCNDGSSRGVEDACGGGRGAEVVRSEASCRESRGFEDQLPRDDVTTRPRVSTDGGINQNKNKQRLLSPPTSENTSHKHGKNKSEQKKKDFALVAVKLVSVLVGIALSICVMFFANGIGGHSH